MRPALCIAPADAGQPALMHSFTCCMIALPMPAAWLQRDSNPSCPAMQEFPDDKAQAGNTAAMLQRQPPLQTLTAATRAAPLGACQRQTPGTANPAFTAAGSQNRFLWGVAHLVGQVDDEIVDAAAGVVVTRDPSPGAGDVHGGLRPAQEAGPGAAQEAGEAVGPVEQQLAIRCQPACSPQQAVIGGMLCAGSSDSAQPLWGAGRMWSFSCKGV